MYGKGRGRDDHCIDVSFGEGSVLDRPLLDHRSGAVTGSILWKGNCCYHCGFRANEPGFSQTSSVQSKHQYSCVMFLEVWEDT